MRAGGWAGTIPDSGGGGNWGKMPKFWDAGCGMRDVVWPVGISGHIELRGSLWRWGGHNGRMGGSRETVIIADDHELFLEGLLALLDRSGLYDVRATARDGEEALEAILEESPVYAVLDASMPRMGGIEVVEKARERGLKSTRFVLVTMFNHGQLIADAKAVGVSACVSKDDAARELFTALEEAKAGEFFVSTTLEAEAHSFLADGAPLLTPREREVLLAVAGGATNKEIADQLGLSTRTVDHHRERLMRKVGAKNVADLVRYAARMGEVGFG